MNQYVLSRCGIHENKLRPSVNLLAPHEFHQVLYGGSYMTFLMNSQLFLVDNEHIYRLELDNTEKINFILCQIDVSEDTFDLSTITENVNVINVVSYILNDDFIAFATDSGKLHVYEMNKQLGTLESISNIENLNNLKNVTQILGDDNKVAILADGKIYIYEPIESKINQINSSITFKKISYICGYLLAISTDGKVYSWGENDCGQLGTGTTEYQTSLFKISGFNNVKDIFCCALPVHRFSFIVTNDGVYQTGGMQNCGSDVEDESNNNDSVENRFSTKFTKTDFNTPNQIGYVFPGDIFCVGKDHSIIFKSVIDEKNEFVKVLAHKLQCALGILSITFPDNPMNDNSEQFLILQKI